MTTKEKKEWFLHVQELALLNGPLLSISQDLSIELLEIMERLDEMVILVSEDD